MKRILTLFAAGSIGILTALTSAGCGDNSAECGPGTVEENGLCVPTGNGGGDGGNGLNCGEGTHEFNGECVDFDPNDMTAPTTTADPAGGGFVNLPTFVTLTSDEVAVIYYTTDGSEPTTASASEVSPVVITTIAQDMQLKFFAVDPAGNTETVNTETYTIDSVAPDPVVNFAASDDGTDVTLTWENPTTADLGGVMIVRSIADHVEFEPTAGVTYAVGDTVAPGEEVVFLAAGTTATDSTAVLGFNAYRAWAMDTAGNFSVGRITSAMRAHGTQTATIEVTLGTAPMATAVVLTQPNDLMITATARYEDALDRTDVDITVDNQIARGLHNVKIIVNSLSVGTLVVPDGDVNGDSFTYLGPRVLAPMTSATRRLFIGGIDGTSTVVRIDITIQDDPTILLGAQFTNSGALEIDSGIMKPLGGIPCDEWVFPDQLATHLYCMWRNALMDDAGRYVYAGNRSMPRLRVIDLASRSTISAVELATFGNIDSVAWAPDREHIYAVLNTAGHSRPQGFKTQNGDVALVKLHVRDDQLQEEARITLVGGTLAADKIRGHVMAVSPDGKLAAVPIMNSGEVVLVDLEQFTVVDVDPNTAGVQSLDVSASSMTPGNVAFTPDNSRLVVSYTRTGGDTNAIDIVNLSDFGITALPTTTTSGGTVALTFDSTGRLWVARNRTTNVGALSVYDLSGPTETVVTTSDATTEGRFADSISFSTDGTRAFVPFRGEISSPTFELSVIDTATLQRIDFDGDANNGLTSFPLIGKPGNHWGLMSP